jgi:hypothetical protein
MSNTDKIAAAIEAAVDVIVETAVSTAVADRDGQITAQTDQIDAQRRQIEAQDANLTRERGLVESLRSQVTELQAYKDAHPDKVAPAPAPEPGPTPTPPAPAPVVRTKFGACPPKPGDASGNLAIAKWGPGIALRRYTSAFPTTLAAHPKSSLDHISFSVPSAAWLVSFANGSYDAACTAMVKSIPAADRPRVVLELIHEGNNKVNGGNGYTIPIVIAAKNRFYDLVKAVDKSIRVASTHTAWLFDPDSKENPDDWGPVKADVLGVDFDGIHSFPYPDYADELPEIRAFLLKWGGPSGYYSQWSVPEVGASRANKLTAGLDDTGAKWASWAKGYAETWRSASATSVGAAAFVCWYDYESTPGNEIPAGSLMFQTWADLIASAATPTGSYGTY